SVPAAPAGTGLDAEVERLTKLVHVAEQEGILLTVDARLGTLTEDPETAAALCEDVAGLGLTLDPSPYIAGPHQGEPFDVVYPHVRHARLPDTGKRPNHFHAP